MWPQRDFPGGPVVKTSCFRKKKKKDFMLPVLLLQEPQVRSLVGELRFCITHISAQKKDTATDKYVETSLLKIKSILDNH